MADPGPPEERRFPGWRALVSGIAMGQVLGPAVRLIAVTYLAIASFVLVMAWQTGPQRLVDAERYATFTGHKDARIVESWIAFELNPGEMGSSTFWPGFARGTPCAVVEYEGEWGSAQRAFCGTRGHFSERTTLHDLREMSPGVGFDFARDANGFSVPEIRMDKVAFDYLAKSEPVWGSWADKRKKRLGSYSALDELRVRADRPVELAIESWTQPAPTFPLAYDPRHPTEALPAGFVAARRNAQPDWFPAIFVTVFGLAFWFVGMNIVLMNLTFVGRMVLGALPLLALPWWSEHLPKALRHLDNEVAATVADTFSDIETTSRVAALDPAEAWQRGGERVRFGVADGLYADTIGRLHYVPPNPAPANADAALAALAMSTATQMRRMSAAERIGMFTRLKRDKEAILNNAGLVFLPAAKEAMGDPKADAELQRAAYRFLSEWTVTPTVEPEPGEPAFAQRLQLYRSLTDIPVTVIAYPAAIIVERAEEKEKTAKSSKKRR